MLCISYHGLRLIRLGGLVKPPKGAVFSRDGVERLGNGIDWFHYHYGIRYGFAEMNANEPLLRSR